MPRGTAAYTGAEKPFCDSCALTTSGGRWAHSEVARLAESMDTYRAAGRIESMETYRAAGRMDPFS